jgi:hypothetical protein
MPLQVGSGGLSNHVTPDFRGLAAEEEEEGARSSSHDEIAKQSAQKNPVSEEQRELRAQKKRPPF